MPRHTHPSHTGVPPILKPSKVYPAPFTHPFLSLPAPHSLGRAAVPLPALSRTSCHLTLSLPLSLVPFSTKKASTLAFMFSSGPWPLMPAQCVEAWNATYLSLLYKMLLIEAVLLIPRRLVHNCSHLVFSQVSGCLGREIKYFDQLCHTQSVQTYLRQC